MTGPVFVNSNILLYAVDNADPRKQRVARDWRAELWKSRLGRVSFQVLNEFYVNAVRLKPAASDEARAEVRDLLAWNPVVTDACVIERGWKLQDRYQLSFWDSLIVTAARTAACGFLLTEALQDGQKLDGVEVVKSVSARTCGSAVNCFCPAECQAARHGCRALPGWTAEGGCPHMARSQSPELLTRLFLSSIRCAGRWGFAVEGVAVEGF
jgi:predicted nucleic acid-binding protein